MACRRRENPIAVMIPNQAAKFQVQQVPLMMMSGGISPSRFGYSTVIYNRLYPRLDQMQPEDLGGFRRSYQTLDHLATYRLLEQKCR